MLYHVIAKDISFEEHPMGQPDWVFQQPQCHLFALVKHDILCSTLLLVINGVNIEESEIRAVILLSYS